MHGGRAAGNGCLKQRVKRLIWVAARLPPARRWFVDPFVPVTVRVQGAEMRWEEVPPNEAERLPELVMPPHKAAQMLTRNRVDICRLARWAAALPQR